MRPQRASAKRERAAGQARLSAQILRAFSPPVVVAGQVDISSLTNAPERARLLLHDYWGGKLTPFIDLLRIAEGVQPADASLSREEV